MPIVNNQRVYIICVQCDVDLNKSAHQEDIVHYSLYTGTANLNHYQTIKAPNNLDRSKTYTRAAFYGYVTM